MRIRLAKFKDLEKIKKIARETVEKCYKSFLGTKLVEIYINNGHSDKYIEENIESMLVIEEKNEIQGMAVIKENKIDMLMINWKNHRKGLGEKLIKAIEGILFSKYDKLYLESIKENKKADMFYRKQGFIEFKKEKEGNVERVTFYKEKKDIIIS